MRTKAILSLFVAMTIGLSYTFAQNYPSFKDNPYAETVKIKGQKPTIVDFANYMFREPEEEEGSECTGWIRDAWKRHLAGKPQEKGTKVTLDVQNGYVKFEYVYEDEDSKILHVSEMCYWNCSDAKHKIVAFTNNLWDNGRLVQTECTGDYFLIYENSSRKIQGVYCGDIGAKAVPPSERVEEGSDGTGWYRIENGKKIYMTTEERNMWYEDTHPQAVYHLPRKGKNITVDLVYPSKTETITLTWDGLKFNAPEGYR